MPKVKPCKEEENEGNRIKMNNTNYTKWKFEKFKDNAGIYLICPECRFIHNVSRTDQEVKDIQIINQYHYCPMCGEYRYEDGKISVEWNNRTMEEFLFGEK
jgi:cellobiose-specific phosphotransferase system component IIB